MHQERDGGGGRTSARGTHLPDADQASPPCWQVPFWHSQILAHRIATEGNCVRLSHVAFECDHLSCAFEPSLLSQLVTFLNGHAGTTLVARPIEQSREQPEVALTSCSLPTTHSPARPAEVQMHPMRGARSPVRGAGSHGSESAAEEISRV